MLLYHKRGDLSIPKTKNKLPNFRQFETKSRLDLKSKNDHTSRSLSPERDPPAFHQEGHADFKVQRQRHSRRLRLYERSAPQALWMADSRERFTAELSLLEINFLTKFKKPLYIGGLSAHSHRSRQMH